MDRDAPAWFTHRDAPAAAMARAARCFPPGSGEALRATCGIEPRTRVVVLQDPGGLVADRLANGGKLARVVSLEPDPDVAVRRAPASLYGDREGSTLRADPRTPPFDGNAVDYVLCADLRGTIGRWGLSPVVSAWREGLREGGRIIGFLGLSQHRWSPSSLRSPEEERTRRRRVEALQKEVLEAVDAPRAATTEAVRKALREAPLEVESARGWLEPFELDDPGWSDRQRSDWIDLVHGGCRERLQVLRRGLQATGGWREEHGALLRAAAADCQQRSLRLRKALEGGGETGGWARPLLIWRGRPVAAD